MRGLRSFDKNSSVTAATVGDNNSSVAVVAVSCDENSSMAAATVRDKAGRDHIRILVGTIIHVRSLPVL